MRPPALTAPGSTSLPIDELLPDVVESLRNQPTLVLQAPPGAGKTTRVPPALLASGSFPGRILMLEPRRVAARAAARRIAAEWQWKVGQEVGYRMRFDRRESADTKILVMTEGTLLAWLQADPFLEGVGAVLFDEIHERSLEADLGLALCRRIQDDARPDLRLVAMSATLSTAVLGRALGHCPTLESTGRCFPVTVEYSPRGRPDAGRSSLASEVARGVRRALAASAARSPGHVLVFLPGVGEIHRAADALAPLASETGVEIQPLYGGLDARAQDAVLRPTTRRKVVLATNVAETSVTIPGVAAVVDTGLARVLRFDPGRGLDRLELQPIARDAADQRTGRAGRDAPGYCLRLWTEAEQSGRLDELPPAIQRVDLSGAVLQLLAWGETDPTTFPWIESPPAGSLAQALELLTLLGARDARGLTSRGRRMAAMPLPPRLAVLVLEGADRGVADAACLTAALLAERDPFPRRDRDAPPPAPGDSDLEPRLEALDRLQRQKVASTTPYGRLQSGPARQVLRVAQSLRRHLGGGTKSSDDPEESLARALLTAFPDRVAKRRHQSDRALMVGGQGLRLGSRTAVRNHEILLALAVRAGRRGHRSEATVELAIALDPAWLNTTRSEEAEVDDSGRVRSIRRLRYRDLVLEEAEVPLTDSGTAEAALLAHVHERPESFLALTDPAVAAFLARLHSLAGWRPELDLPLVDATFLRRVLPSLVLGCRSLSDLERAPLLEVLRGSLLPTQLQALKNDAPTHVVLPSGRRQRLEYQPGQPPVLAARIQQLFGLRETPTVAGGRVRVLVHLLAPNGRPQQITEDLGNFWRTTYAEVRKELRGRYPKHAWPEDPTAAFDSQS